MAANPSDSFYGTIPCVSQEIYESGKREKTLLLYTMCIGLYADDTGAGARRLGDFSIPPFVSAGRKRRFQPTLKHLAIEALRREKLLHLTDEPRPNFQRKSSLLDWLTKNPITQAEDIQFLRREEKKFFDKLTRRKLRFIPPSTVNDDNNNDNNAHGGMTSLAREATEAIVGQPVPILPTTTDRSVADDEHIDDVEDDEEEDVAVDEENGDDATPTVPIALTTVNGQTSEDTPAEPSDPVVETPGDVNTVENDIGESEETSNTTSPARKRMRVEQQHVGEVGGESAAAIPFIPPIQDVEIEGQHHPNDNIMEILQQMSSALNQSVSLLRNVMTPFLPPTFGSPEWELAAGQAEAATVAVAPVAPPAPPLPQGTTSPSQVEWLDDHEVARREAAFDIVHKRERIFLDLLQETSKITNTTIKAIFEQRVIVAQENLKEAETIYRQLVKQQQQRQTGKTNSHDNNNN